ncbi:MAG: 5-formyltetrahydrofolate cyclo-ligase [Porphyromonas sp.]|nr:5-formyltetrahydrofolate cyclo-ligase [Porphyromonas sp.]
MKQALRQRARELGKSLSIEERQRRSASVYAQLVELLEAFDYQRIGIYMPMHDEPELGGLYDFLELEGKELYLPRVIDSERIVMLRYRSGDTLERNGRFALREPELVAGPMPEPLDVVLVPAVHFHNGYRLGRGKGYYDRYLAELRPRYLIGLSLGLLGQAPFCPDPWDEAMDFVIQPKTNDTDR